MPDRATEAEFSTRAGVRGDFDALVAAFDRAASRSGVVDRHLVVAGFRVRLRAAGPALLEKLWPALAHLTPVDGDRPSNGDASPALTIQLWDTASTGVPFPDVSWVTGPGAAWDGNSVANEQDIRMVFRPFEGEFVALDARADLAVMWVPDHAAIPVHVRAAPFLVIWHWWMRSLGAHPVHAAAVGELAGGVLLVGPGGSGKSTTSLACLLAGMHFASDDYVILAPGPDPVAASLFCTAKVAPMDAARFPELEPALERSGPLDEKMIAYITSFREDRVARSFPIRAVVTPRVVGGSVTRLLSIHPAEALAALAPSTLLGLPIPDATAFAAMAEAVRRVPTFRLELGSDPRSAPPVLQEAMTSA